MSGLALVYGTLGNVLFDILPVLVVLLGFQLFVLRKPILHLRRVLVGFISIFFGLAFFLIGLEQALFPIGKAMAEQLTNPAFIGDGTHSARHWYHYYPVYLFAFFIGTSAVMVEPAVIAVAIKANKLSSDAISVNGLRIAIALGVGVGITVGCFRIITGGSLLVYILCAYLIVILQTTRAPRNMIPLAYDAGGVSTSTVTVPLVAALGLGLAMSIPGRSPLIDGFGMIAFAVLFPIISVLLFAQLAAWRGHQLQTKKEEGRETPGPGSGTRSGKKPGHQDESN